MIRFNRTTFLILLCLLLLLSVGFLNTPRVKSVSVAGGGVIRIQSLDYSIGSIKTLFVFDEEPRSDDFRERSTSWLIIAAYEFPIGRADPDWQLIGKNNVTLWHYRLEKTFDLQCDSAYPNLAYPFESFTIHFYIASNITRSFSISNEIPNFSAAITQEWVQYNQTSLLFQPEGCPNLLEVTIRVFHDYEYMIIASILYVLLGIIFVLGFLLSVRKKALGLSNYLMVSSSILIFLPVFFFAFRGSLAPKYLTGIDWLSLLSMFVYGAFLLKEVWRNKTPEASNSTGEKKKTHDPPDYEPTTP